MSFSSKFIQNCFLGQRDGKRHLVECTKLCSAIELSPFSPTLPLQPHEVLVDNVSGQTRPSSVCLACLPENVMNNFVSLLQWKSWKRGKELAVHCFAITRQANGFCYFKFYDQLQSIIRQNSPPKRHRTMAKSVVCL